MKPLRLSHRVATIAMFVLALGSATVLGRQQGVEIVVDEVGGSVSVLYGRGGNIGLSVGDDGLLLIDTQFAELADPIRAELAKRVDGGPVFLVNTHFHGDHVGGNVELGRGAQIVAHANVRRRMAGGLGSRGRTVQPSPAAALPDVTFEDGLSIHFNGEEVRLIHLPGAHTDGDVVVWFTGSNVVHFGDALFNGRFPFLDVGSGGRASGAIAGLERVLALVPDDVRVIPGHGQVCGVPEVRTYIEMLRETSSRVQQATAAGRSVKEMQEMRLLDDYADWGDTGSFLGMLAASLAAQ